MPDRLSEGVIVNDRPLAVDDNEDILFALKLLLKNYVEIIDIIDMGNFAVMETVAPLNSSSNSVGSNDAQSSIAISLDSIISSVIIYPLYS